MESIFTKLKDYQLTMVESGELGWDAALENEFDCILMDINLPGIDGKELTQKLRETHQYKNKPIIAVSAAAMTHNVESAENLFDNYLTKPIDIAELIQTLKRFIS